MTASTVPQAPAAAFDVTAVRARFPALARRDPDGRTFVFADAPGGTQVPDTVIEAISAYLRASNANSGGPFVTSRETDAVIAEARRAGADVLGAAVDEVVFGPNMTSLAFAVSRSIGRTLGPLDEIVVTRLDHDANVAPWLLAAEDAGATVRWVDVRTEDVTLDLGTLASALGERTRLVAFTLASNATGTITPAREIVELVRDRAPAALVVADAVHVAQHRLIDVRALGMDILFCSPYKFFGPHMGLLWARPELIEGLRAYKVRPAHDRGPDRWETGTKNHESLAGLVAAVEYLAWLGRTFGDADPACDADPVPRRRDIAAGMEAIGRHEAELTARFLSGLPEVPGLRLFGISDPARARERSPTFAVRLGNEHPSVTAAALGDRGVFVWDGDYYATEIMQRLGLADSGGAVRIGFCHYATVEEVDRVLAELRALA
jgi:cysteine desulfurase family protein (TIGR01976 family)